MEIVTFVCVSVATPCIFLYRISFYFNNWFAFSPNPFVFLFIFVHLARFCRNFAFEGGSAMLLRQNLQQILAGIEVMHAIRKGQLDTTQTGARTRAEYFMLWLRS